MNFRIMNFMPHLNLSSIMEKAKEERARREEETRKAFHGYMKNLNKDNETVTDLLKKAVVKADENNKKEFERKKKELEEENNARIDALKREYEQAHPSEWNEGQKRKAYKNMLSSINEDLKKI